MDEWEDMARELLVERVGKIRRTFEKGQPDRQKETAARVERLETILDSLPAGDRKWLDDHLTDGLVIAEKECTALYLGGLKDGLRLLRLLTI